MLLVLLFLTSPILAKINYFVFNLTHEYVALDGVYKAIMTINGMSPGPSIEVDEGDYVHVTINNFLHVRAAFHFHGVLQKNTPWADGVPGITQYPIPSGGSYVHHFRVENQSGALWYHSHFRGYSSDGLYGILYVRPGPHRERPYHLITSNNTEIEQLMILEKSPTHLIADDTFKQTMDDVIARMFHFGVDPVCIQSVLVNGKGRVYCHSHETFYRLAKKNKHLNKIPHFDSMGCMRDDSIVSWKNKSLDHYALELPGYSPDCKPTLADNFEFYTNGKQWQYANLLNAGGQYTKSFSIDDHELWVVAVDGTFVIPQRTNVVYIPAGSRVSIVFQTKAENHEVTNRPFSMRFTAVHTPQFIEGKALLVYGKPTDYDEDERCYFQEYNELINGERFVNLDGYPYHKRCKAIWAHHFRPLEKHLVLQKTGAADVTYRFYLNRTDLVLFTMFEDGSLVKDGFELAKPLLQSWDDGDWDVFAQNPTVLKPMLEKNNVADFIISNWKHINHPIHIHGHYFHLVSYSDRENFPFASIEEALAANYSQLNLNNPPLLDVVLVPVGGHAVLRITADNPGIWLIHCHNIGHLLGGMGAVLLEAGSKMPPMPEFFASL